MIYDKEDVKTLAEVGFIARSRGLYADAAGIFAAVRMMRPHNEAGYLGGALICLHQRDPASALALLKKTAPSDLVLAFMGLALLQLGEREDGLDMLRNLVKASEENLPGRLALVFLEEAGAADSPSGAQSWIRLPTSPSDDEDARALDERQSDPLPGADLQ